MKRFVIAPAVILLAAIAAAQGSDLCATATPLPAPGVHPGTNVGATASGPGTVGGCSLTGNDVWFSYTTTSATSRVIASTCPPGSSTFSTAVDIFTGTCAGLLTPVCSSTWCTTAGVNGARAITPIVTAGTSVLI